MEQQRKEATCRPCSRASSTSSQQSQPDSITTKQCRIIVYIRKTSNLSTTSRDPAKRAEIRYGIVNSEAKITWKNPRAELPQLTKAFANNKIDMEEIGYRRVDNNTFEKINCVCMNLRHNQNNNNLLQEIKVVQHDVQHWFRARSIELGNYYRRENPDMILLNSTGVTNQERIRIYNYNVTCRNFLNEMHAGVAVAVRKDLQCRIIDDIDDDILGVQIETTKGPIMLLTHYSPPRRHYIPTAAFENKLQKNMPVYFAGDLNAHLPAMGYNAYNQNGREIQRLIQQHKIMHLGPDFRTFVHGNGRLHIVFLNRVAFLNYAIERGSLTTSDHFPIILKLSEKPIIRRTESKTRLHKTNWETFKNNLEARTERTFNLEDLGSRMNIDADEIEELYGQWYKNIDATLEETTQKRRMSFYIHARDSDFLKLLEINYQNLSRKPVWTTEDMETIRNIQQLMREENLRLYREAWEKKLEHLNRIYKDSSKFLGGCEETNRNI